MRSQRTAAAILAIAWIAGASCTPSNVSAEADVTIGGNVARENGSAANEAKVFLGREGDIGEAFTIFAFGGLPCLSNDPPPICQKGRVAKVEDGRYRFDVKGSYTHGFAGQAATLVLSTRLPRQERQTEGPGTTTRFQVQTERVDIPLTFWEPLVEARADRLRGRFSWSAFEGRGLPADANVGRAVTTIRFQRSGGLVWEFSAPASPFDFDTRLLEDSKGDVSVSVSVDGVKVPAEKGTKVSVLFRSARFPYASPAGRPISRGRACFGYDSRNQPISIAPCKLTDGDFVDHFESLDEPCPSGQDPATCPKPSVAASVDLGKTTQISLIVLRGCTSTCRIESSIDGSQWQSLGVAQGEIGDRSSNISVTPPGEIQARFVRVAAEGNLEDLREVSIWDPSPPPSESPPGGDLLGAAEEANRQAERERGGRGSLLPWIATGALLVVAVGFVLTRSRRSA